MPVASRPPILAMNRPDLARGERAPLLPWTEKAKSVVRNQVAIGARVALRVCGVVQRALRPERCQIDVAMRGRAVVDTVSVVTRW